MLKIFSSQPPVQAMLSSSTSHLHGVFVASLHLLEDILSLPGPPDGTARQSDHPETLLNPFVPWQVAIFVDTFFGDPAAGQPLSSVTLTLSCRGLETLPVLLQHSAPLQGWFHAVI